MDLEAFFNHHCIKENPFRAEEARDDPVFEKLGPQVGPHLEFEKILGRPDRPSASVVFGEKGSGKTALRLMMQKRLGAWNLENPDEQTLVVRYDNLNPVLDQFAVSIGTAGRPEKTVDKFSLFDHQDAILTQAVTTLVDQILTAREGNQPLFRKARKMTRDRRVSLAHLIALYDQDTDDAGAGRQKRIMKTMHLRWFRWEKAGLITGILLFVLNTIPWLYTWWQWDKVDFGFFDKAGWITVGSLGYMVAFALMGMALWRIGACMTMARRMIKNIRVTRKRAPSVTRAMSYFRPNDLTELPTPVDTDGEARYILTRRLVTAIKELGFVSVIVLVDRVDEPTMINGRPELMRHLIWPLFNNKFLQQEGVGMKLLLPVELRHMLHREDPGFFQAARLDKQQLVDRLDWTGSMLYDVCSRRMRVCLASVPTTDDSQQTQYLSDLFDDEVRREDLVDALDQMRQPRDAFKFLYAVLMEHCANVTEEQQAYKIPKLTLETVRRRQSQRIKDFEHGLIPG